MIICLLIITIQNVQKANNENLLTQYSNAGEQKEKTNENSNQNTNEIKREGVSPIWKIEIPEISLIANISEGIEEKTLDKFVGHFSITPKIDGNIGLAAHNRGYEINYFTNLKQLKGGEKIIYTYGDITRTYVVEKNIKITETDWSYLENSNENKITLITCIENEPEYRRCVQAIEKEESKIEKNA